MSKKKAGRKKIEIDFNFILVYNRVKNGQMTVEEACEDLMTTPSTFYRLKRRLDVHQYIVDKLKALEIDDEDIYKSFKSFYNSGCNAIDMLKDKSTKNFKTWTEKQYISFARKNPVYFFCKSSSEFFTLNDEKVYLNKGLQQYLNNHIFINHVKDAIDFRQKEYYKNRFDKK